MNSCKNKALWNLIWHLLSDRKTSFHYNINSRNSFKNNIFLFNSDVFLKISTSRSSIFREISMTIDGTALNSRRTSMGAMLSPWPSMALWDCLDQAQNVMESQHGPCLRNYLKFLKCRRFVILCKTILYKN